MPDTTEIKAGIVIKSRFRLPGSKEFAKYIDYIDRDEAIRNENFESYSLYNDYMGNPEKSGALFTDELDKLDQKQSRSLKRAFRLAQERDSLMWQNVISFDNRFLAKHGAYDPKTKWLDEAKMRELTRSAMAELLGQNGISESALWSASIHYNTDNIHIHVAVVEPVPTRKRGKLLPKSFAAAKSRIAGTILDRRPQQERIQQLVREQMIHGKRRHKSLRDKNSRAMFRQLYQKLPADRRAWVYNSAKISHLRADIDAFTTDYLRSYHAKEFAELKKLLEQEQSVYKEAYGGKKYDRYAEGKLRDLYTRMGNTLLTELREYSKEIERKTQPIREGRKKEKMDALRSAVAVSASVRRLERSLSDDVQKARNQFEYERLQRQVEYEGQTP